mgnify:CR=1 FL=1
MNEYRVFHYIDAGEDARPLLEDLGVREYRYEPDAVAIGEEFGEGRFMLIRAEAYGVTEITVGSRVEYFDGTPVDPTPLDPNEEE